jgi:hypothetical protein
MRSADGSTICRAVAHTVPRCTFSTSASTTSPGMAPDTNTMAPSCRAIIRPPAAGRSIVSR